MLYCMKVGHCLDRCGHITVKQYSCFFSQPLTQSSLNKPHEKSFLMFKQYTLNLLHYILPFSHSHFCLCFVQFSLHVIISLYVQKIIYNFKMFLTLLIKHFYRINKRHCGGKKRFQATSKLMCKHSRLTILISDMSYVDALPQRTETFNTGFKGQQQLGSHGSKECSHQMRLNSFFVPRVSIMQTSNNIQQHITQRCFQRLIVIGRPVIYQFK